MIDSKNCITLADVIRNAPGVQLTDGQLNIRSGSGWSYGTGSRVLVMVDDMPILSADQGEVEFNLIDENVDDGNHQRCLIGIIRFFCTKWCCQCKNKDAIIRSKNYIEKFCGLLG